MLSGSLMTTFLFFEILSLTSFIWVMHEETPGALRAGYTYLFIAVIGGLVLFMGMVLLQHAAGTLVYEQLPGAVRIAIEQGVPGTKGTILAAGICILVGFGCKAGMFPVHVWLPKAHPVAPSPASALLSGVLTKVGIYGILMTSVEALVDNAAYGWTVLILGTVTMLLGAVLALFSVNLKRTLACSSMSQIGFILTGVGMLTLLTASGSEEGYAIALPGLMLHMVNHSLIKLTLFMAAGVVVMNLHKLNLNDIRGWGRNKTALKIAFALGALGISGVPLFNGYMSKTLLHEGIVEGIHLIHDISGCLKVAEWVFLISGGLTFCYMLKLFICIFVEKNDDPKVQESFDRPGPYMNLTSSFAIVGSSLFCILLGQPFLSTRLGAFMSGNHHILHFKAFTLTNLKGGAVSLAIGAVLYLLVVRGLLRKDGHYANYWPAFLDLENLFCRSPLTRGVFIIWCMILRIVEMSTDSLIVLARKTFLREKCVKNRGRRFGLAGVMAAEIAEAGEPIVSNFTFALLMTCLGIVVMLFAIVYFAIL
jgi:hydrogenase-4 component B